MKRILHNKDNVAEILRFDILSHEHIDYPVITKHWLMGFVWSRRCYVCGRIIEGNLSDENGGLLKKCDSNNFFVPQDCLSLQDIVKLYPNQEIYNYKDDNCSSRKFVKIN